MTLEEMAVNLTHARLHRCPLSQFSKTQTVNRQDAYLVQIMGIDHRLQQGEKRAGFKMGLTSEAKRKQMNLDSPLYGELTDSMQISDQGELSIQNLIHPKIEPEVAFYFHSPLAGTHLKREEVLAACSAVAPALEILDSRYQEFQYFSMEDVISDNSSSSHFVVGPKVTHFTHLDLTDLPLVMEVNGQKVQQGNTRAISGDPIQSVIDLCHLLAESDRAIEPNQIVLAGAATSATALEPGMLISTTITGLGQTSITITGS